MVIVFIWFQRSLSSARQSTVQGIYSAPDLWIWPSSFESFPIKHSQGEGGLFSWYYSSPSFFCTTAQVCRQDICISFKLAKQTFFLSNFLDVVVEFGFLVLAETWFSTGGRQPIKHWTLWRSSTWTSWRSEWFSATSWHVRVWGCSRSGRGWEGWNLRERGRDFRGAGGWCWFWRNFYIIERPSSTFDNNLFLLQLSACVCLSCWEPIPEVFFAHDW